MAEAKRLRTRIKLAINNRQAEVMRITLHATRGNPRAFWDTVDDLLWKGKNTNPPTINLVEEDSNNVPLEKTSEFRTLKNVEDDEIRKYVKKITLI